MDRTLRLGPSSFQGISEANLSSQEEIGFLSVEIQNILQKQVVSVALHTTEKGVLFYILPGSQEDSSIQIHFRLLSLDSCFASKIFTERQLPQASGSVPGSPTLGLPDTGQTCVDENSQLHGDGSVPGREEVTLD